MAVPQPDLLARSAPVPAPDVIDVAVVGAGASGALVALHLVRAATTSGRELRVVLIESTARPVGSGVAYGTNDWRHLLNVRAAGMSALPDEPGDFLDWARSAGFEAEPQDFLPRRLYGVYLRARLAAATDAGGHDVRVLRARVLDVLGPIDGAATVVTSDGPLRAGAVVLATGNPPPAAPTPGLLAADRRIVRDPWAPGALREVPRGRVLLVGTGLTMVDVVASLAAAEPSSRFVGLSRRGLLPLVHPEEPLPAAAAAAPAGDLSPVEVFRELRRSAADAEQWQQAVDGVRPRTAQLWASWSLRQRRSFVRHGARLWDVHRHRMSPEAAESLHRLSRRRRFEVRAGSLGGFATAGDALRVELRLGDGTAVTEEFDAVVNCTGPAPDGGLMTNPALRSLVRRGVLLPHPTGLGVVLDERGRIPGAGGIPLPWLHVLGVLRRGELWESTSVPELRGQAASVATEVLAPAPVVLRTA